MRAARPKEESLNVLKVHIAVPLGHHHNHRRRRRHRRRRHRPPGAQSLPAHTKLGGVARQADVNLQGARPKRGGSPTTSLKLHFCGKRASRRTCRGVQGPWDTAAAT